MQIGMDMTLQAKLGAGRFVITAEVTPPVSVDRRRSDRQGAAAQGPGRRGQRHRRRRRARRISSAVTAAAILLLQNGIEPILQFTCRDRNRIALQSDLMGAAALGVRNLLMLRGDDPKTGDQPDAKPVFDLDTAALIATAAARCATRANCRTGRKIGGKADFFIGAADMPIDPPAGLGAERA